jgi:hypothetical protein
MVNRLRMTVMKEERGSLNDPGENYQRPMWYPVDEDFLGASECEEIG